MKRKKAIKLIAYIEGHGRIHDAREILELAHRRGCASNKSAVQDFASVVGCTALIGWDVDAIRRVDYVERRYLR